MALARRLLRLAFSSSRLKSLRHVPQSQDNTVLFKASYLSKTYSNLAVNLDNGQPTADTHPELLRPGEIMPGVTFDEMSSRRRNLISALPTGSLVILCSPPVKQMTELVPYPYRQGADYLYYTGCQQPGSIAAIYGAGELCMFMPDPFIEGAFWEGRAAHAPEALTVLKADRAYNMSDLDKHLPRLLKQAKGVYVDFEFSSASDLAKTLMSKTYASELTEFKEPIQEAVNAAVYEKKVHNVQKYTHEARWVKSSSEINLLRHSAGIGSQAFLQTMKVSRTRPHEHLLAATMEYECKIRGAQRMAFPSVVASGANATVIHYWRNDQPIREGEMLLMDAGCDYFGYLSDITRTWSPSGVYSSAQKDIYEAVLSTYKDCIKLLGPGSSILEVHRAAKDLLLRSAKELGILQRPEDYMRINPTSIGHYLGMDVHDCKAIREDRKLVPGVVVTIEPGLYIPVADDFPKWAQGIGVRIEDDVLITESGHEVLTASIPKELNEIEAWIQCCKIMFFLFVLNTYVKRFGS